ncbi:MAG: hypothetical protein EOO77_26325 [Oxalobacteraceae bacterium]|nr:MAG: hypothetical protein EOO77_26325 [Oxalobacteraceae bacterium]
MSDSIIDEEDDDALYISMSFDAKMVRLIGTSFLPVKMKIRADVNPEADMSEEDVSIALMKIRFYFDNIVSKGVAFSFDNEEAMAILINEAGRNRTGNVLMITPGEPTDEVLATLFQAKMGALSGGRIEFSLVEVKSDNQHGLAFIFVGNGARMLPTMEQWIGKRSFFTLPWWSRDDASTLDVIPPENADLSVKPPWAFSLDGIGAMTKASEVEVVRPSFRPTVIPGGK